MQKGNKKELKKNKKILKADKITYILKKYFLKFVLKVKRTVCRDFKSRCQ